MDKDTKKKTANGLSEDITVEQNKALEADGLEIKEECFIITPIGVGGSETYTKAMGLIDAVIQPVLDTFNLQSRPANRMEDLGSINKQLIKRILEDKLVIANLTGLNPNVMYELAVRHAARLPVIIMAEIGTKLPFDISDQRTIFYTDTLAGVEAAKKELQKKIGFALKDEYPDNPIYAVLENSSVFKKLADDDPYKIILEKIDRLETRIVSSENNNSLTAREKIKIDRDRKNYDYQTMNQVHGSKLKFLLQSNANSSDVDRIKNDVVSIIRKNTSSGFSLNMLGNKQFEVFFDSISLSEFDKIRNEASFLHGLLIAV